MKTFAVVLCLALSVGARAQSGSRGRSGGQGLSGFQANHVTVTALNISPLTGSAQVGSSLGFTAIATFSNGAQINVTRFTGWTVNNTQILSLLGLSGNPPVENIKCLSSGTGGVTASYAGATSTTTMACTSTVPPPPSLVSIALSPVNPSQAVGQAQGFNAIGTFSDGSTQDVTAAATWASGTPGVAMIGTLGAKQLVNCISGGTSLISATIGAIVGSTTLTCNAVLTSISLNPSTASILVGQTQGFIATGLYNDGSSRDVTLQATWSSSASSIAAVTLPPTDPELVTGETAGTATITAAVGSISGTASITVSTQGPPPPSLVSIALGPANPTINVGSTIGFVATCTYSDNSTRDCTIKEPIQGTATVWTSGSPSVATLASPVVDPETATGVSAGTSTITATIGAIHGSTTLTVQNGTPTLSSVTIGPPTPTVTVGSSIGFTATCHYSDGSTQDCTIKDPLHGTTTVWTSSATGVATMASPVVDPEPASCVAVGTSTINAQISSTGGNTLLTCQPVQPPSFGDDAYETVGNVCHFGATDSFANLPFTCIYTNPSALPSPGTLHTGITTNAAFNTAAASAACGDVIEIVAGSVLNNLTFPAITCDQNHYITIRTSGYASLPAYGTRVKPCYAGVASLPGRPGFNCANTTNVMAQITTTTTAPALTIQANSYFRLLGLEITRASGTGIVGRLLTLQGSNHIVVDHVWCHGDETGDETSECFGFNATSYIATVDSFYTDFYCVAVVGACTDAHPIGGGTNNTPGCTDATFKVVNNFLEGAAQSLLLGGGPAGCTPLDLEYRLNYAYKPYIWDPICTPAICNGVAYNGGFQGGHPPIVKNQLEFKNAQRVLVEGNVFQNLWISADQFATAILVTPKDQSNQCPLCQTLDITVRYNYITAAANPIALSNAPSDAGGFAQAGMRYSVHDNVADNLMWGGCASCNGSSEDGQTLTSPTAPNSDVLRQVNRRHNTWIPAANPIGKFAGDYGISGPNSSTGNQMSQANFLDGILTAGGGINNPSDTCGTGSLNCACKQTTPTQILNACFTSYQFGGNALVGTVVSGWPGTNCTSEKTPASILVNYNNGVMIPGGDFHVKTTSPCHNTATDGTDPGAAINTLLNRIQGVTTF